MISVGGLIPPALLPELIGVGPLIPEPLLAAGRPDMLNGVGADSSARSGVKVFGLRMPSSITYLIADFVLLETWTAG